MTYVRQPIADVMKSKRWSTRRLAEEIGCDWLHLVNATKGKVHPREELRVKAAEILGVPVDELFTAEVLSKTYTPRVYSVPTGRPKKKTQ